MEPTTEAPAGAPTEGQEFTTVNSDSVQPTEKEAAPVQAEAAPEPENADVEANEMQERKFSVPAADVNTIAPVKNFQDDGQPLLNPEVVAALATKIEGQLAKDRKKLTDKERAQLSNLMGVVQNGLDQANLAARGLREIEKLGLWEESHDTFPAFCRDMFDMSAQRVTQLVKCAEELAVLQQNQVPEELIPVNERGIRAIRRVKNPNKAEVLRLASKMSNGARPTSATIEDARLKIEGPDEEADAGKSIKVQAAIKAAKLVDEFLKTCNRDDLKVKELTAFKAVVNEITKDMKNLETQTA